MQSVLLLGAVGALIVAPGLAAALLVYRPGDIGIVTRCAAVFGIGFAISGGWAFVLAVVNAFYLAAYLPVWALSTLALWALVLRRADLREHIRAILAELSENRPVLVLGAAIMVALIAAHTAYLQTPAGPHYVYILNGIEIANSHGIPIKVLEYGQAWPPATDKVFLDAFTGVVVTIHNEPLIIPGVMLWLAYAGAAIGLWAIAWELGLRRTGVLLPVLMLANTTLAERLMTQGFSAYRAEDFGMAIAFCALALGISAIRTGRRGPLLAAAFVLAAGSGSHLVPIVIVVIMLAAVILAELLRRGRVRARWAIARDAVVLGGSSALMGLVLRLVAGGSFGLGGAVNQSTYSVVHTQFDPTDWLASGRFFTRNPLETSHFYLDPFRVMRIVMNMATDLHVSTAVVIAILAVALVVAVGLLFMRTELGAVGFAGAAVLFGVTAIALYFSYRYHVWIEATFGVRRPVIYAPIGVMLLGLGLIEALLMFVARYGRRIRARAAVYLSGLAVSVCVAAVIAVSVWLVPTAMPTTTDNHVTTSQRVFTSWVRTNTPCGARFLLNQRSEGTVAALTGRYALDEGMGAYLRPNRLPHVISLLLAVRDFFNDPSSNEALLRTYHIDYVVEAPELTLGYMGPVPLGTPQQLQAAPFLHLVLNSHGVRIYHVDGSQVQPVSPLLKGPYLQCRTGPVNL